MDKIRPAPFADSTAIPTTTTASPLQQRFTRDEAGRVIAIHGHQQGLLFAWTNERGEPKVTSMVLTRETWQEASQLPDPRAPQQLRYPVRQGYSSESVLARLRTRHAPTAIQGGVPLDVSFKRPLPDALIAVTPYVLAGLDIKAPADYSKLEIILHKEGLPPELARTKAFAKLNLDERKVVVSVRPLAPGEVSSQEEEQAYYARLLTHELYLHAARDLLAAGNPSQDFTTGDEDHSLVYIPAGPGNLYLEAARRVLAQLPDNLKEKYLSFYCSEVRTVIGRAPDLQGDMRKKAEDWLNGLCRAASNPEYLIWQPGVWLGGEFQSATSPSPSETSGDTLDAAPPGNPSIETSLPSRSWRPWA